MCVHYRVKSRCPECIADEMKGVVLLVPRGQAWNTKRPSFDGDAAAAAAAREAGTSSPTNKGARKDTRPDASARKPGSGIKPDLGESGKLALGEPALGDPAAGVPKVPAVAHEPEWEGEKAHLKQQIETLRMQHAHAVRYF